MSVSWTMDIRVWDGNGWETEKTCSFEAKSLAEAQYEAARLVREHRAMVQAERTRIEHGHKFVPSVTKHKLRPVA